MKENSPFKFLDAYQKEDYQVFFGREKETDRLYEALSGVKHLLVYGPSGSGKTSLIECGLRNQFSDADWFALSIRRGYNINASVFARIEEALEGKIEIDSNSKLQEGKNNPFGQAVQQLFEERFQPVYLLFDQFEELLILGNEEEQKAFFKNLNKLISYKIPCRILLIMREEFIGHLSEFEGLCPTIFKHRFRVEKMRKNKVGEVVEMMLKAPIYQKYYDLKDGEILAKLIIENLPDDRKEIELTYVQLFLDELWYRAIYSLKGKPLLCPILVDKEDNLKGILNNFLRKQLDELDKKYGKTNALLVLNSMISESHTKKQMTVKEIEKDLNNKNVQIELSILLQDFEEKRIVRSQKSDGHVHYEICHDLLAKAVGENLPEEIQMKKNAERMYKFYEENYLFTFLNQDDIAQIKHFEKYRPFPKNLIQRIKESEVILKEKEKERLLQIRRARLKVLVASIFTLITFLVAAVFAITFYFQSKEQSNEALKRVEKEQQKKQKIINAFKTDIEALFLSGEKIDVSISNILNHTRLKVLILEGNSLDNLPSEIEQLKELTWLDLSGNELDTLRSEIEQLKELTWLDLSENELNTLPLEIGQLQNLTWLDLSGNELDTLRSEIEQLQCLTWLDLSGNELDILPAQILELQNLTELSLSYNNLDTLLLEIGQLKNLRRLNLSGNQLETLPVEVGELQNLTSLFLSDNELKTLPAQVGELQNLTELYLSFNQLTTLPSEIRQLKNLTDLYLFSNQLSTLPSGIGELQNLTNLDLSFNQLDSLPSKIGQLINLTKLELSFNQLDALPVQTEQLKNLTTLYLNDNNLKIFPSEIMQLQKLTTLSLGGNKLDTFPLEIGQLHNLTTFYVNDNNLNSLPLEKGPLKNLVKLDLTGNNIQDEDIIQLQKQLPNCTIIWKD